VIESYKLQLLDERWQKKRETVLALAMYKCAICKHTHRLEVHHLYYVTGKRAWEYPHKALIPLCSKCHRKWHKKYFIQVRDSIWKKNKMYQPPLRGRPKSTPIKKKKGREKVRVLNVQQTITLIENNSI
jgi:5-methylcytosine-specific restriction endonuclease McrA